MPKVSIIVPIYNVEEYVRKTIDSIVNQTEKDIEIILVDDGSTDASGSICDEYAEKDDRIVVIHKSNGGLSSARNAGIQVACSEYIMLLDGDDFLDNEAICILEEAMIKYPSDFVQFHYQEVRKNGEIEKKKIGEEIYQAHSLKELYDNLYKIGGEAASACTKLYKKELLKKVSFEDLQHEDEMWCTQAFQEGITATYIPHVLYYYVVREDSIIHREFNLKKLDIFKVIEKRIQALEKNNLDKYIHIEYRKMFLSICSLYCQAQEKAERKILKSIYKQNKKLIHKNATLCGKYKTLSILMNIKFEFINTYKVYSKIKVSRKV